MGYVLKEVKPLTVGGITFLVRKSWGAARWAQRHLKAAQISPEQEGAEERAADAVEQVLLHLIVDWQEVADEQGAALPWGAETLALLEPDLINELLAEVLGTSPAARGKAATSSEPERPLEEATP